MKYVGENKNSHIANKGDILFSTNNLAGIANPKQGKIYCLLSDNVGYPKGYYKWDGTGFVLLEYRVPTLEVINPNHPDNYELVFA